MNQEDIILCAFRYCLGRMTYIVREMTKYLQEHWDELNPHYQALIIDEIRKSIKRGNAGMDMDVKRWENLILKVSPRSTLSEDISKKIDSENANNKATL